MNLFTPKLLLNRLIKLWSNKDYALSSITALIMFFLSLFVNYAAMRYTAEMHDHAITDIILNNIHAMNTDIVFSEGSLFFVFFVVIVLLEIPETLPFVLKSIALFIYIRSTFVIMTHLGPPTGAIRTDLDELGYISSGADLFFSGHTGLPYLMALIYWNRTHLRNMFLTFSIIAASAVLLGHLHYSIDVFSAFFITYSIYHIAKKVFTRDFEKSKKELKK